MPSSGTSEIDVGGGGDYTSWVSFESAITNLTGVLTGKAITAEKITGVVTFSGFTTSASNYLIIQGTDVRHNGQRGDGHIIYSDDQGGFGTLTFAADVQHWEIRDLEIVQDGINSFPVRVLGANTVTGSYGLIDRCLMYSSETSDDATLGGIPRMEGAAWTEYDSVEIRNCVVVGCVSGIVGTAGDTTKCIVNYCTIVKTMTDADSNTVGSRYCTVKNTYAGHFGGDPSWDDYLNEDAGSSDYASHDTSGDETGIQPAAIADQFTNVTASAWDLSLKSGSDLEGLGSNISGITVDIAGNSRDGSTPDIGAFEFTAGGPTGTGTPAAQAAAASGAGIVGRSGTGTPAAQAATAAGVGERTVDGTGAPAAQVSAASGAGTIISTVEIQLTAANSRELKDVGGVLITTLNNVPWEWYDDPDSTAGNPTDSGTLNISAAGEVTFNVVDSVLANGQFGQLILYHPSDPDIRAVLRVPVVA